MDDTNCKIGRILVISNQISDFSLKSVEKIRNLNSSTIQIVKMKFFMENMKNQNLRPYEKRIHAKNLFSEKSLILYPNFFHESHY